MDSLSSRLINNKNNKKPQEKWRTSQENQESK
jgi:hypothetical protein